MSIGAIIDSLAAQECIAVVLVDATTLRRSSACSSTGSSGSGGGSSSSFPANDNRTEYIGHFILLVGYSAGSRMFIYLDPSNSGNHFAAYYLPAVHICISCNKYMGYTPFVALHFLLLNDDSPLMLSFIAYSDMHLHLQALTCIRRHIYICI